MSDNEELIQKLDNWFNWALANGSNPIWKDKTPGESALNAISPLLAAHDAHVREEGHRAGQQFAVRMHNLEAPDCDVFALPIPSTGAEKEKPVAINGIPFSVGAFLGAGAENTDSDEKEK